MEDTMTDFNKSRWADSEFAQEYRDNADIYIVDRRRMFGIMKSFYRQFVSCNKRTNMLDLGCGDGIVTHELLQIDNSISALLIDPSDDMLCKAKERLKGFENISYAKASFQEIIGGDILPKKFDFIVSAQAIHHLTMDEKKELFNTIHAHLRQDGYFLNLDVILAPANALEQWYMQLWNEWMDDKKEIMGIDRDLFSDITRRYGESDDNKPDTLDDQLNALRDTGFSSVDCFYKYGIFTVYGGKK
jgi:tRNA (cmo5U34)-methyltransferase